MNGPSLANPKPRKLPGPRSALFLSPFNFNRAVLGWGRPRAAACASVRPTWVTLSAVCSDAKPPYPATGTARYGGRAELVFLAPASLPSSSEYSMAARCAGAVFHPDRDHRSAVPFVNLCVTSSPRCAGKQCSGSRPGLASRELCSLRLIGAEGLLAGGPPDLRKSPMDSQTSLYSASASRAASAGFLGDHYFGQPFFLAHRRAQRRPALRI